MKYIYNIFEFLFMIFASLIARLLQEKLDCTTAIDISKCITNKRVKVFF